MAGQRRLDGRRRTRGARLGGIVAAALALALLVAALPRFGPTGAAVAQDAQSSSAGNGDDGADSAAAPGSPDATGSPDQFANVTVPPDVGQTDLQVYVSATGHTVRGSMLDYWRANGATSVYGDPISEPFAAAEGYYSQAFENGVFQYRPEFADTNDPTFRLMPIGQAALGDRLGTVRSDGRRGGGGGDRRGAAWRPLDPKGGSTVARVVSNGGVFVADTGHTISGDFLTWYNAHEGRFYLGDPLSQPVTERGMTVQYFQGALLMSGDNGTYLAPVAKEAARELGIPTKRVSRGGLPEYDESLFYDSGTPATPDAIANAGQSDNQYLDVVGDIHAPGRKRIEISLSDEKLWAYQGDTLMMTTPVSTGLQPNPTAPGDFHIRLRFAKETMTGFTNQSGEVVALGNTPTGGGQVAYDVPDIPNVMYFNTEAEALHGAYWHNNFGNPMSHGCVNLPLEVAAWMYGWAPLGTEVWIHQ